MAKTKRNFKRVLVISDTHCGHNVGLTPPEWWTDSKANAKAAKVQREMWRFYSEAVKELMPIDILIENGDAIDGKGTRSGGSELITADRNEQCRMAAECINYVKADKVVMLYGTAYHTGNDEDLEEVIASQVNNKVKLGSHEWLDVNGKIFDCKHFIGPSKHSHLRYNQLAIEVKQNRDWFIKGRQPKGDIFIRSHVHYHTSAKDEDWLAMTTPALQGYGSKFGARICSGIVDIGLIYFDVSEKGDYVWRCISAQLPHQQAQSLKL